MSERSGVVASWRFGEENGVVAMRKRHHRLMAAWRGRGVVASWKQGEGEASSPHGDVERERCGVVDSW
ncbi:hypothetical protein Bca4012_026552 [Brassica carinata]